MLLLLLVVVMVVWPASCLLPAHCYLPPVALLLLHYPFAMEKNVPAGQENTMVLKDGIMYYNDNLGGQIYLLKPCIKHMFQLLDATAAAGGGGGDGGLACLLPAACSLLPAVFLIFLLLLHPFAMKKTHLPDRKISWR